MKPTYEELEQQLTEQVAYSNTLMNNIKTCSNLYTIGQELHFELQDVLKQSLKQSPKQSPKQSLLLHDADVIDNFMSSAITAEAEIPRTSWDFNDLETYAMLVSSNLRNQAKEFKK
jgi:hypothetical protein